VGNLTDQITESVIYSHFFIYGEIEQIEMFPHKNNPHYAFVRFKLTSCASRAFDQCNGLEIAGQKIKVQFSDFNKRPECGGDVPGYDLTD
jgi:RNA recognition motif-containing protein